MNFEYKIEAIDGDSFTLKYESTNAAHTIKKDLVKEHFIHSYCRTCDSHGSSISEEITIFDLKFH